MTQQPAGTPAPATRPASPKRIIITVLAVVAAIAVLCGVGQLITNIVNRDPLAKLGQPVAAVTATPSAPSPTWTPPNMLTDPKPELEIRHELEEWLLKSAGVAAALKSRCDTPAGFNGGSAANFPCTVTYGKLAVTYQVSAKPSSSRTFTWDATAAQTVVTRKGLLAAVANLYRTDGGRFSDLRCEDLPEVALVATGTALDQHCYVRIEGQQKTATINLIPTRSEVRLDTQLQ